MIVFVIKNKVYVSFIFVFFYNYNYFLERVEILYKMAWKDLSNLSPLVYCPGAVAIFVKTSVVFQFYSVSGRFI